jgi:hypothetical protein
MTAAATSLASKNVNFATDYDPATRKHTLVVTVGGATLTVDGAAAISVIGSPTDAAWNGTDPGATLISVAKKIAIEAVNTNTLLAAIKANTTKT